MNAVPDGDGGHAVILSYCPRPIRRNRLSLDKAFVTCTLKDRLCVTNPFERTSVATSAGETTARGSTAMAIASASVTELRARGRRATGGAAGGWASGAVGCVSSPTV